MSLRRVSFGTVLFLAAGFSIAAPTGDDAAKAAARFAPEVRWKPESALQLNFTCRGRKEFALIGGTSSVGTTVASSQASAENDEVVVAIFFEGLAQPPKLLRVGGVSLGAASLAAESLDYPSAALKMELGAVPEGWRRSKTCAGLNLSDGATDAFHIYWHTALKGVAVWRL